MPTTQFLTRATLVAIACALGGRVVQAQTEEPAPESEAVTYEQVRPVFKKHCVACHNADRERGGLDLSTISGIKSGGASGDVAVPGKPEESLLYTLPAQLETPKMPPNKPKIPQREIDLIRRWIEGGAFEQSNRAGGPKSPASKTRVETAAVPASPPSMARAASGLPQGVAIEPLQHATAVTALAVSPISSLVAVSGRKQVVLFQWADRMEARDKTPLAAFPFPEGDVFALRFSRDGELLLAGGGIGGQSGSIVGFEVASGKRLFELGDESDVVLALDISPDKQLVALGGPGRAVKIFRMATGELVATLRKHTDWILSLAFSPDSLLLASGDRFGGLEIWEAASGKKFHTLRGHAGPVHALAWVADSDRLLSAGQDGLLRIWNMHDGSLITRWDGETGGILAADCDAAGRIICGGREKKVAVWDKPEWRSPQTSAGDQTAKPAATDNGQVTTGKFQMPDVVVKLALSHDSSHAVAADAAGNISVFSLEKGELAGNITLPLAPAVARAEQPPAKPSRSAPAKVAAQPTAPEVAAAEEDARRAAAELADVRELSALNEVALKTAEESLKKLRESAAKLARVVAARETKAKETANRATELRAKAEAAPSVAAAPAPTLDQMHERLTEKRSLLESARAVAERIARAARKSPGDTRLEAAAKLAAELRNELVRDVEAAVAELHEIEEAAGAAQQ